jgi:hypothetical protein
MTLAMPDLLEITYAAFNLRVLMHLKRQSSRESGRRCSHVEFVVVRSRSQVMRRLEFAAPFRAAVAAEPPFVPHH